MSWCAVFKCHNKTENTKNVSFYELTKNNPVRKEWIHAIGRPTNNLPGNIYICSDHFEEKCFDPSWDLQNRLYYHNRKKRKLIPGSVPTLLLPKEENKIRTASEKRNQLKRQKEVILRYHFYFNIFNF